MSNLEHYFENLLFHGQDVNGDWNKNTLSEAEQEAVRICADYVLYTIFLNRDDFLKFVNGDTNADRIRNRAKSDEGLADLLSRSMCSLCVLRNYCKENRNNRNCDDVILEWLKQEEK